MLILRLYTSGEYILARYGYFLINEKAGSSILAVYIYQVKVICYRVAGYVLMWVAPWLLDSNDIQLWDCRISEQWGHNGLRFLYVIL
jgi:hypothetical protein